MDEDSPVLESEKNNNENTFQKAYGWYLILNRIASNDFTKHEYIFKKKIMEVLNQMGYLVDYEREQARLQKKAQTKR